VNTTLPAYDERLGGQKPAALIGAETRCEKCLAPLDSAHSTVCRNCGWYASAGRFVEIDRSWEADDDRQPQADGLSTLPRWAWVALASALAVVVQSVAVRCLTPDGSLLRSAWSGIQFALGLIAVLGCQFVGYFVLMKSDSSVSVLDAILKPFKVVAVLFRGLPQRFWIVNSGISGLAAVLAAVVIIGSVPYHVLWSWKVGYRSTQYLEDALARQGSSGPAEKTEEEPNRANIDCLIIGYQLNDKGNVSSLLVAREQNGRLRYVGGVAPAGDPAMLFELRENLMAATQTSPVIPMEFTAQWVAPKFTCRISYTGEQDNKNLTDVRWEGDVQTLKSE
jgi:hypothetical protein